MPGPVGPPWVPESLERLISTRRISQRIRDEIADEGIKACAVLIFDFAANSQESRKEFDFFSAKYFAAPYNHSNLLDF